MTDELEVDRDAIVEMHRLHNLAALADCVAAGDFTQAQAVQVHKAFMASAALQKVVAIDVATLEAMLSGQVH